MDHLCENLDKVDQVIGALLNDSLVNNVDWKGSGTEWVMNDWRGLKGPVSTLYLSASTLATVAGTPLCQGPILFWPARVSIQISG